MRTGDTQIGKPAVLYKNTKANIEALSGIAQGAIAYATDTDELGTYDGVSAWTWGAGGGGGGTWGSITGTLSSQTDLQSALDGKQAVDGDLTAIAALAPANDDVLQRKAGAWTNRTIAQLITDLGLGTFAFISSLAHSSLSGIGTNTHSQIDTHIAASNPHSGSQPLDSDLTDIAALAPSNDDVLQRKAGAWTNRTIAQLLTDLGLAALYAPIAKGVTNGDSHDHSGGDGAAIAYSSLTGAPGTDGWTAEANTWTFKNRTQAFTNDPAAGNGIVLNVTDTTDFFVGADIIVSSGAGTENTIITAIVANTSITCNQLLINHNTTSRLITLRDTFTINADVTANIKKGTYLKFTQTTVKYGTVGAISVAGGTTTITLITNTDYTLANAAISATYYSNIVFPAGFPVVFNYDPEPIGWSVVPVTNVLFQYYTIGNLQFINITDAADGGTSNATNLLFSAPVTYTNVAGGAMLTAMDNSALLTTAARVTTGSTGFNRVISCQTNMANGTWTASGAKRVTFQINSLGF